MYTRIIAFLYRNTRPELHSALLVLVYAGTYAVGFAGLALVFPLVGWQFNINFELSGYFIGCIGAGELARALSKTQSNSSFLSTGIAGATTVGIFWLLMVFKWGHPMWGVPVAATSGALLYLLLGWLQALEQRKQAGS